MAPCEYHDDLIKLIEDSDKRVMDKLDTIDEAIRGSSDGEVQGLNGRVRTLECKDKRNSKIQMAALIAFIVVIVESGWNWITSK